MSQFSFEDFCLTVPKFSVGKAFSVSLVSGIEKSLDKRGEGGFGVSGFSVEIFLSQSAEIFRRRTLLCCVSEKFR